MYTHHLFFHHLSTIKMAALACLFMTACKNVNPPVAFGPVPSERQMLWQEMEYYAFIHFGINTFTDVEWGYGDKAPALFNPTSLDCRQWARVCKEAGMKGIILTAKHHDGFCLWPSVYTDYSVKNSPWQEGQGDLIKELADACKEYGLKLGIYLSPWDRNHPDYGKPEYITYFRNQLKEVLSGYGEIFEVWFDGANGGSGYYGGANETRVIDRKSYYDWENTFKIVRELQPHAVIFSDGGPDVRWCGNEEGWVGETNWSLLRRDEVWPGYPHYEELRYGHEDGNYWVPAEVNVSIRPGWFYHESEDSEVKKLPELLDIYYHSFGRNGTLLINFPIDKRGLIHETDSQNIVNLAQTIQADFEVNLATNATISATNTRGNTKKYAAKNVVDRNKQTYWATNDDIHTASLLLDFGKPTHFNRFLVQEYIRLGQRVEAFILEAFVAGEWHEIANETTIGYKRILRFPTIQATKVRFTITKARSCPLISNLGIYNAPEVLLPPAVERDKKGYVKITTSNPEAIIYYTTDNTYPTVNSQQYAEPFLLDEKVNVRAIAVDSSSGKSSPEIQQSFDISKKDWTILSTTEEDRDKSLDGNPQTSWFQYSSRMPVDLIIDMGSTYKVKGFRYLPDQGNSATGVIFTYQFFISMDNKQWKLVSEGEFSNLEHNPLWQICTFDVIQARFVKFRALTTTNNETVAGYAEFDIITE